MNLVAQGLTHPGRCKKRADVRMTSPKKGFDKNAPYPLTMKLAIARASGAFS